MNGSKTAFYWHLIFAVRASVGKATETFGAPTRRREDEPLLRGVATFGDDIGPPKCVHLKFLRSAHASGALRAIELKAALACPGVLSILTAEDTLGFGSPGVNPLFADMEMPPFTLFARERVDAVGQPVAVAQDFAKMAETMAELAGMKLSSENKNVGTGL